MRGTVKVFKPIPIPVNRYSATQTNFPPLPNVADYAARTITPHAPQPYKPSQIAPTFSPTTLPRYTGKQYIAPVPNVARTSTIHCMACKVPFIHKQELPITNISHERQHCPLCGTFSPASKSDQYDFYSVTLATPRSLTLVLLRKSMQAFQANFRKLTPKGYSYQVKINKSKKNDTSYSYDLVKTMAEWADEIMSALPNHGVTHIDAHCKHCASTFKFTVSDKTLQTHAKPLSHCPYGCGHTLIITPAPISDDPIENLAIVYDIEPLFAKAVYHMWQTKYTSYATFDDFYQVFPTLFQAGIATFIENKSKQ